MSRRFSQPGGGLFQGRELYRLMAAISLLVILGLMIQRAGDPQTWRWLARGDSDSDSALEHERAALKVAQQEWVERVVTGPADDEPEEVEAATEEYQAVSDKSPLTGEEMPSYWRMMRWSRTQSYADLQSRARRDVLFTQLWERPAKYRGQLIELRLHLKRALAHDAPKNSAGVQQVYEAWGWTEDSKSFPYVVVFSERPPSLPLGADIHEEATFVGYFLKTMSYEAYDVSRAAPLLIGRLRWRENPARVALRQKNSNLFWPTLLAGTVVLGFIMASWIRSALAPPIKSDSADSAKEQAAIENWLERVDQPESAANPPPEYPRPAEDWLGEEADRISRQGNGNATLDDQIRTNEEQNISPLSPRDC